MLVHLLLLPVITGLSLVFKEKIVTLHDLEEELKELDRQREQAVASLNAIAGAMQFCRMLMEKEGKNGGQS